MNILKEVEKEQIAKLSEGKSLPTFKPKLKKATVNVFRFTKASALPVKTTD